MKSGKAKLLIVILFAIYGIFSASAQLVADGATNLLTSTIQNISGNITIGTNGSGTLLIVSNSATINQNSGDTTIGANGSASGNRVIVTGPNARWNCSGNQNYYIGNFGASNGLDILSGGVVTNLNMTVGFWWSSSNNLVTVVGNGSKLVTQNLNVGGTAINNSLIVSNGGTVLCSNGLLNSIGTLATVTGTNTTWTNTYFTIGNGTAFGDQLSIRDGANFVCASNLTLGINGHSNLLFISDTGSVAQCRKFSVGSGSSFYNHNGCVISNGARLVVTNISVITGSFDEITVTGRGSLWTNNGDIQFDPPTNSLFILNGGALVNSNAWFGINQGAVGANSVIVSGTNSVWLNRGELTFMENNTSFFITNGATVQDTYGYIATTSRTNCFAMVSGPGSLWTNGVDLHVGDSSGNNRLVVTDSAQVKVGRDLWVSAGGASNQLIITNKGWVVVPQSLYLYNGSLVLDGGTLNAKFLYGTGPITFNSGLWQSGGAFYLNSIVIGDGTNRAVFEMLNNGTNTTYGGIVVSSNATMIGSGTAGTNIVVNDGGTIAPGTTNTIGVIRVIHDLTLNSGSTTFVKLNATSGSADTFTNINTISYNGTLLLTNISGTLAHGQSFKVFSASSYSGEFAAVSPASPGDGLRWDTSELNVDGVLRVFSTNTPPPMFTTVSSASGNLVVSASGGIPFDPCYLFASTNLTTPLSDWSCVSTNFFNVTGTTTVTNAMSIEPQQYLQLRVN